MPTILHYQDNVLQIETGIDMRSREEDLGIASHHNFRDLSNSIKMRTNAQNVKCIQFVTRIVPDLYTYTEEGTLQWLSGLPGGSYEPIEERAIFCCFVSIDDLISYKILWSMQNDMNENAFYSVKVERCSKLPNWAIKTIVEDYLNTTNDQEKKIYALSEQLRSNYNPAFTSAELLAESKEDCLEPLKIGLLN